VWHFGDSTTSTEENPVHSYSENGSYSANLTIYENATINPQTITKNFTVDIGEESVEPPVTEFTNKLIITLCAIVLFVYIIRKKKENRKT
jgi:PKD repeat protein